MNNDVKNCEKILTDKGSDNISKLPKYFSVASTRISSTSNDLNNSTYCETDDYYKTNLDLINPNETNCTKIKCECGAHAVGSTRHDSWCPLYNIEG